MNNVSKCFLHIKYLEGGIEAAKIDINIVIKAIKENKIGLVGAMERLKEVDKLLTDIASKARERYV